MTTVAEFSVEYTQYLDESGAATQNFPDTITTEALQDLYKKMVYLRAFDKKAIALQRTGKMGTYASTLGQEAISTAIGYVMQSDDVLAPFYRDYGAMLQRGVTMADIYRYWGGDERGSCYQDNPHDLPISVPIASQCLHAVGAAYSFHYRRQKRVAVTTIGDGGTSQGDFYEALNCAGAWQLPVVFVINNNQWAISVPISKQTRAKTLAQKAIAAGIPGEQVDGNDIVAVVDRVGAAIERARQGGGPSLIEAMTYRLCDHTTADDASRYRNEQDVEQAWQREPIARLRNYLQTQQAWDDARQATLDQQVSDDISAAVADYENTPAPLITDMFDYTYAELPSSLELQRQMAIEDHENG